jgi:superfamily II DNA helicase RecQ
MMIASATLPDHILDDIRRRLSITNDAQLVALSNDRPNIALSVRVMKHSEESKADLRFLIPNGASSPDDIPITLVYANERNATEDISDNLRQWAEDAGLEDPSSFIVFYHAKIGTTRKREIEEELRKGNIHIAVCTDAVGMVSVTLLNYWYHVIYFNLHRLLGCDMRNIQRVILWGLPPSFCALVQRAGRAGRDFSVAAEAVLIVTPATMKKGISDAENLQMVRRTAGEGESEIRNDEELETLQQEGIVIGEGNVLVSISDDAGIRVSHDTEEEEAQASSTKKGKRKRVDGTFHSQEAEYLNLYLCPRCRHSTWNEAFKNHYKSKLFNFGELQLKLILYP